MPGFAGFDYGYHLVLVCAYTGKEVVGCKVQIVIVVALTDQVRWLRLRAVALRGVPVEPWSGRSRDILSQTIREYGLNPPGTSCDGHRSERGATKSDHLRQSQPVHRTARRAKALRAVLVCGGRFAPFSFSFSLFLSFSVSRFPVLGSQSSPIPWRHRHGAGARGSHIPQIATNSTIHHGASRDGQRRSKGGAEDCVPNQFAA